MSRRYRAPFAPLTAALLAIVLLGAGALPARAAGALRKPESRPDLLRDVAALAQIRPRACAAAPVAPVAPAGWKLERDECAWHDLLRVRRWSAVDGVQAGHCVSSQAQWWAWSLPPGQSRAWQAAWTGQARQDETGPVKRIVVMQRAVGGQWSATEWRWTPSAREATRRWQQGRWDMLAALALKLRQSGNRGAGPRQMQLLQAAWENNLGARAGEIGADAWRWRGDGMCMRTEAIGLGQQQFHLPFAAEDSRLEQRAAMQLQLARRYPKAVWRTPFRLMPGSPQAGGGAKFDAVWVEGADVKGELWIPTRGDGPLVRLRIAASPAPAQPGPAATERAAQAVENELAAIARVWQGMHE
ncbi:MAG: hypothetical protein JWR65_2564 [Massilia sp.]|nr:hypothetical protein [Massilia sp.]